MMVKGPVHRLLTFKNYAVEMVDSLVKETDLDPCAEQTLEGLGVFSVYDLPRVRFCLFIVLCIFLHSFPNGFFDSCVSTDGGTSG